MKEQHNWLAQQALNSALVECQQLLSQQSDKSG
jgi:hypothetical protein